MTTSAKNTIKKSKKHEKKIARFFIDVLAVYTSQNEIPVSIPEAFNLLKERLSSKTPHKFEKCIMQIWNKQETYSIVLKSKEKNKILETIDINSIGKPSCSELDLGNSQKQSLIFLPLLNKNNIAELFIFHPNNATAQEVVMKISRLLENRLNTLNSKPKDNESIYTKNGGIQAINTENSFRSKTRDNDVILPMNYETKENNDRSDTKSIYSISSNFINNWYGKLDSINIIQPNSLSSLASVHEELHSLNKHLKEIRHFMNELFNLVYNAVQEKKRKLQDNFNRNETQHQIVHLPSKLEFIEIVEKIKSCLNLAAAHKEIIINPSSEEITNQLFIYLKILADATTSHLTGKPNLMIGIKNPQINSTTVKFLTNHLNVENTKFWMILGYNYGFMRGSSPSHTIRSPIDEFEIKEILNVHEYEQKNYPLTIQRQFQSNNRYLNTGSIHEHDYVPPINGTRKYNNSRESPVPLINSESIYRSFPRLYEPEKKKPLFYESENYPYQNLSSHSQNVNCYTHSTWDGRQCRFIDAIRLRNGRIGKVLFDRSVQNYQELGVSCNEVVEILRDYGDMLSVKNALGEIGECPKSIISEIQNRYAH